MRQLSDAALLTGAEIDVLAEESPILAEVLRGQQTTIGVLAGTVEELQARQRNQLANEEAAAKSEIQDAIDVNPTLASWQTAKDPTLWNEAMRCDKLLRESPLYANVPYAERFAKVVALTQSAVDVEARQELDERETERHSARRTPGGKNLEEISSAELGQQFLGKSREEIDTYIANLIR